MNWRTMDAMFQAHAKDCPICGSDGLGLCPDGVRILTAFGRDMEEELAREREDKSNA